MEETGGRLTDFLPFMQDFVIIARGKDAGRDAAGWHMKKRIFLSDIDGTLLKGRGSIPEAVAEAARKFAETGWLCLCTGRSLASAEGIAGLLGVNAPSILLTGAELYDFQKRQAVWTQPMEGDIRERIAWVLEKYPGAGMQVCTETEIYHLRLNERQRQHGVVEEAVGRPEYRLEDVKGEILKLVIAGDDIRELEALGREVFSGGEYKFAFASRHFTEVVSSRAGKDAAMKKLAEIMKIPVGEFFAAGDSMTDLPMLKLAGTSFAPEDAMEAVKACCEHIVPSPVHGGMQKAFAMAMGEE